LRDANEELQKLGVKVFGVSFDTVAAQEAFATKQKLPYELIADVEGKVVKAFGVPSRGKFASRQAYLFKDGKLAWKDEKASTTKQAEDVLKAIEQKK
jgi:peroxiredoxin Q/BCP